MSTKNAHTHCDNCGRTMVHAHRVDDDMAYCSTCYAREFKPKFCMKCGCSVRAHRNDEISVCRPCRRAAWACVRCGRQVKRAGLLFENKPVCGSCAPFFRQPKACELCGKASCRLTSTHDSHGLKLCEACQRNAFATCAVCRRYRVIDRFDAAGKPVCKDCSADNSVRHICPECGTLTPGSGYARCPQCALLDRVKRRIELNVELIEQTWCRELFTGLFRWLSGTTPGNMTQKVDHYAKFFRYIDKRLKSPTQLSQQVLFELVGAEGLRRWVSPVTYLIKVLHIPWSLQTLETLKESKRIEEMLQNIKNETWHTYIEAYIEFLMDSTNSNRTRSIMTVRMYLRAAINFLNGIEGKPIESINEDDLRRHLKRLPGTKASLSAFIKYLRLQHGIEIKQPPARRKDTRKYELALLRRIKSNLSRLETSNMIHEKESLFIDTVAKLYGLPKKHILQLQWDEVNKQGEKVFFRVHHKAISLEPPLDKVFDSLFPEQRDNESYVFKGRNPLQPRSYSAITYHLAK